MRERFTTEMKQALKAGDKRRLGTIRLIQAALKDKDIEARGAGREKATEDEILARLRGRREQEARSDDDDKTVKQRLKVYLAETAPLLDYYRTHGLLREVHGIGKPDDALSGRHGDDSSRPAAR